MENKEIVVVVVVGPALPSWGSDSQLPAAINEGSTRLHQALPRKRLVCGDQKLKCTFGGAISVKIPRLR